jgi:acyl dehydratase
MTTAKTRATTLKWGDIEVGDEVTPLEIPITTTMIVAGAVASRDFMPVHHDRDYANKQGSPNLFMNILTSNGYCVRFLTDWAGPCFPDDPLRFTGTVTGKAEGEGGENFVEVTFRASNSLGDHVSGTAVLSLLDGAGA